MSETATVEAQDYSIVEGFKISELRPRPKHILVRWYSKKETKGGVLLPEYRHRAGILRGQVLAVGPECDKRLTVGCVVQFGGLVEKEFLGPQIPGDRDPVFFMREESVVGLLGHSDDGAILDLINGNVLITPDLKDSEKSGIIIVNREKSLNEYTVSGIVADLDPEGSYEFKKGDRLYYHSQFVEEIKVGDFEAPVKHFIFGNMIEDAVDLVEDCDQSPDTILCKPEHVEAAREVVK